MSTAVALLVISLVGLGPALGICGVDSLTLFAAPLCGSVIAGTAAVGMAVSTGDILQWFLGVSILANLLAVRRVWRMSSDDVGSIKDLWVLLVVAVAVAWPLWVLTAPIIGYDGQAIWLLHSAMFYGGHGAFVSQLTNPGYSFSMPGYPPLVPGTVALAYTINGGVDQHLGVIVIGFLNSSVLGLAVAALLKLVPVSASLVRKSLSGLLLCGLAGAIYGIYGVFALNGYADPMWVGCILSAVVLGAVLPRSPTMWPLAALCLTAAGLTKEEGFSAAVLASIVLAIRYRGAQAARQGPITTLAMALVPLVLPIVWFSWAGLKRLGEPLVSMTSGESINYRLGASIEGMWGQLHLLPVGVAVALLGGFLLRRSRRRINAGNPLLIWALAAWCLAAAIVVYLVGPYEIHWWLANSVNRTSIVINALVLVDMTVWALALLDRSTTKERETRPGFAQPGSDRPVSMPGAAGSMAFASSARDLPDRRQALN